MSDEEKQSYWTLCQFFIEMNNEKKYIYLT